MNIARNFDGDLERVRVAEWDIAARCDLVGRLRTDPREADDFRLRQQDGGCLAGFMPRQNGGVSWLRQLVACAGIVGSMMISETNDEWINRNNNVIGLPHGGGISAHCWWI